MFTGIIEDTGIILSVREEGTNRIFQVESAFTAELKEGDSVAHNGVCLTVESISAEGKSYQVSAIQETLSKTMLGNVKTGDSVNLERSLKPESRLDGHFVQGHVDTTAVVKSVSELDGSYEFTIAFHEKADFRSLIVPTGSICLNGISLTVGRIEEDSFSVYIIPHTYSHTTMNSLQRGDTVNLEFDVLGKYVKQILKQQKQTT